jgi:hypothetical protein
VEVLRIWFLRTHAIAALPISLIRFLAPRPIFSNCSRVKQVIARLDFGLKDAAGAALGEAGQALEEEISRDVVCGVDPSRRLMPSGPLDKRVTQELHISHVTG